MAQEKTPNEKPKRTRKPKAGSDALPVEQITELMLVHNKNDPKFGVQAVSEIDKDGKAKTVPADEKNENSFLKFDKNSSILENFIKNFWSQFKEPTHFRLLRMTYHDYKVNKQAIRDLSEGKQTDAVKEFLKRYEIRPRENKKEQSV
ncbi:copper amine oxidase, partial [Phocaeicola vulgatus]